MMRLFFRLSLKTQFTLQIAALIGVAVAAGSIVGKSLVVSQTLNQGRSIAQMVEHIGKWGSQYGGIHVRGTGTDVSRQGSYLERRAYAASSDDHLLLSGKRVAIGDELTALARTEAYYWKNPALIQREISDISVASPYGAKFRITARTVLNPNNAPTPFELEALNQIAQQIESNGKHSERAAEYSRVVDGQLLYARAMIAGESCLRCHGDRDSAPGFLRTNSQFNGGGGFGYLSGKTAGIISVSVPLSPTGEALAASLTVAGWAALAAFVLVSMLTLGFVITNVIAPLNGLRKFADTLASARLGKDFSVPDLGPTANDAASRNEVHRLAAAISRLGRSLKYMHGRSSQPRP